MNKFNVGDKVILLHPDRTIDSWSWNISSLLWDENIGKEHTIVDVRKGIYRHCNENTFGYMLSCHPFYVWPGRLLKFSSASYSDGF